MQSSTTIHWRYSGKAKLPKSKLQILGGERRTFLIGHFPQLLTELLFIVELYCYYCYWKARLGKQLQRGKNPAWSFSNKYSKAKSKTAQDTCPEETHLYCLWWSSLYPQNRLKLFDTFKAFLWSSSVTQSIKVLTTINRFLMENYIPARASQPWAFLVLTCAMSPFVPMTLSWECLLNST